MPKRLADLLVDALLGEGKKPHERGSLISKEHVDAALAASAARQQTGLRVTELVRSPEYVRIVSSLPVAAQEAYEWMESTLRSNPSYPGLKFQVVERSPGHWRVNVMTNHYRALLKRTGDTTWDLYWAGTHAEYDRKLKTLENSQPKSYYRNARLRS